MRYLSVCSGVEAASVAWHPLGWEAVGFSEIEKFPSAVLAHHYPNVPNFGDMTKHETWPLAPGSVDLLVGGTPCQSFSVAGLRKGLADPRGNLMLTYLAIADRLRPRWIVWENVPGVLSSNGGRDFGTFLGALGELGYGWAYRVLDAQWCRTHGHPRAVAQRRRRVFVVGCLGDSGSAAAVLFERESVFRDTSTRRKAEQDPAESVAPSVDTVGGNRPEGVTWRESDQANAVHCDNFAGTLNCNKGQQGGIIAQPIVIDRAAFNQGPGAMYPPRIEESEIMSALVARGPHAVATATNPNQEVATTLSARDYKGPSCGRDGVTGNPIVCTTHAVAHTLTAGAKRGVTEDGTGRGVPLVVAQAVPFYDPSPTLTAKMQGSSGWAPYNETAHLVGVSAVAHAPLAFTQNSRDEVRDLGNLAGCLSSATGTHQATYLAVAHAPTTIDLRFATTETEDVGQTLITARACGSCVAFQEEVKPVGPSPYVVRRLTPTECERLQGFPDDWTAVPFRGKPAADGPRYKALGNSMAVNCMEWIGQRIAAYEAEKSA